MRNVRLESLNFNQSDITDYRRRMVLSILEGELVEGLFLQRENDCGGRSGDRVSGDEG